MEEVKGTVYEHVSGGETFTITAAERCYIVGKPRQTHDRGIELRNPTYHAAA